MWTAAWVFFYGAYHVILFRDSRFLLVAFSSSLVHFSFFSANIILVIYYFVGNRNLLYIPLAIISFVIPQVISPVFSFFATNLGGVFENRYSIYTDEDNLASAQEALADVDWFLIIADKLVFFYLLFALIMIQIKYKSIIRIRDEQNLYSFLLLFLAFVNFGKSIPSFGGRFQLVFFLFATLYIYLIFIKLPNKQLNFITLVGLFPMALFSATSFRQGADSIDAFIFLPGLGLPFLLPGYSLAELFFY
jgi:hypothetical protein